MPKEIKDYPGIDFDDTKKSKVTKGIDEENETDFNEDKGESL